MVYKHLIKSNKIRQFVATNQTKRISLKSLSHNLLLASKLRLIAYHQLTLLPKKASPIKVRNRCVLSGRSRGVYNYLKISRVMLRSLAAQGLLFGVKKAS